VRVLVQRVSEARVEVDGETIASIGRGLLLLVAFTEGDDRRVLARAVDKTVHLRVFADDRGRFAHSLLDVRADLLVVPQFTLYGDTSRGRRPDFTAAMEPGAAARLFDVLVADFTAVVPRVGSGRFGAGMQVALVNDGPVTLMLDFR
jgi:D-tyrosyl-tRNA(Tyr) deacylase